MIETLLEYKITEAENGQIAIDFLEKGDITYDLIILDLYMPEKDGFDVLKYI
jgi:CheY-like chemotaxis protein